MTSPSSGKNSIFPIISINDKRMFDVKVKAKEHRFKSSIALNQATWCVVLYSNYPGRVCIFHFSFN